MSEENRYWEAFGLTPPVEGGGTGGEPADNTPAEGGEVGTGEAPPAGDGMGGEPAGGTPADGAEEGTGEVPTAGDGTGGEPAPQETEEQRLQKLENRIRGEMQQSHDAQLREIFSAMGLKDQDGNPITTVEAYQEHQRRAEAARLERDLKAGKLTTEGLQAALANLPGIKETVEAAQRVQQEAGRESFIANREVQLAQIRKMNPNIHSLNDIVSMETGKAFIDAVNKGLDYVSAYKVANHDDIVRQARAAGAQAARNGAASKAHLQQTTHNTTGGVEVTQEMRARYRRFKPDITDAQIAAAEAALK